MEGILIPIIAIILSLSVLSLHFMDKAKVDRVNFIKEQAYHLFLYAEKQDWVGPTKMSWVARQIVTHIPNNKLVEAIGEQRISDWLQDLYDDFKGQLEKDYQIIGRNTHVKQN